MLKIILYLFVFKPIKRNYWHQIIHILNQENTILALTTDKLYRFYPLIVISGTVDSWQKKLTKLNPIIAKTTHLTKGEKE